MITKSFSSYFLSSSCLPQNNNDNNYYKATTLSRSRKVLNQFSWPVLTNLLFQSSVAVPGSFGVSGVGNGVTMLAPISGQSPGLARAQVSHGVRQVSPTPD